MTRRGWRRRRADVSPSQSQGRLANGVPPADHLRHGSRADTLDRLQRVAVEIAELSDGLAQTDIDARLLRHWSFELNSIRAEIEQRFLRKPLI
jgi:uncharacterized protein (DUF934 family)